MKISHAWIAAFAVAGMSCGGAASPPVVPPATSAPSASVAPSPPVAIAGAVPLFEGLGPHRREVTTSSPEAQRYFDQGLSFMYAFNHDEAIRAFRRASELDPRCSMAQWGVALANGPHINNPTVDDARAKAAWSAVLRAREYAAQASPVERALIEAMAKRYASPQPADRAPLDRAYADAMRQVARAYPDDADVAALFAESLMDLRPWDLFTAEGKAQPGTDEILTTLEGALARSPKHPLANHLYIHAVEASPSPEKADAAADRLRDLQPALGHMVHMPSHIDVRRGRWQAAALANEKAIEADRRYREREPRQDFYRNYMAHNRHMLAYAALMQGQSEKALGAIRAMLAEIPAAWMRENAGAIDGFTAMPVEVLMRFGHWDEILAAPEPAEHLPVARAMRLYARGVAKAVRGDPAAARAEQAAFLAAKARVPASARFGNNAASDLLAVAEHVLAGELLYRDGKADAGITELREAVRREDALRYDEPPDWIQPVRHALGAALVRSGRAAEAEAVYREDLRRLPDNGWSLFGLGRSLRMQKKDGAVEAEARFAEIWRSADLKLSSSCFCLPGI